MIQLMLALLLQQTPDCIPRNQDFLLEWDDSPSAGVTEYRVYHSTTSGGYNFATPISQNVLPHPNQWTSEPYNLADGQHFFVVTAANATNESLPSNEVCILVDSTIPEPPINLRAPVIIQIR